MKPDEPSDRNEPVVPEPPQLGDGFSPPQVQRRPQEGRSLADPAEPPHPAPWATSDF